MVAVAKAKAAIAQNPRKYTRRREFVRLSVGDDYIDTQYTTMVAMVRLHDPFQQWLP